MDLKTIFSEGKKERQRRKELNKKRNELNSKQKVLVENLSQLGRNAWEKRTALEKFPELKVSLEAGQCELEKLDGKIAEIRAKFSQNEIRKKEETDFFDREKKNFEQSKATITDRLNAEKTIKSKIEQTISVAESQLKQIARRREELQRTLTDPATTPEKNSQAEKDLAQLSQEESRLLETIKNKREELQNQNIRLEPIEKELAEVQQQIDQLQAKRREILGGIETELGRLQKELENLSHQKKVAQQQQEEYFRVFGEKLAAAGELPSELNSELGAVREIEQSISSIQAELKQLEERKDQTAIKAYKAMRAIIWGGLFLLIAMIIILFVLLQPGRKSSVGKTTVSKITGDLEKVERSLENIRRASEKQIGKRTSLATASDLGSVLVDVPGWEKEQLRYEKFDFSGVESASSRTVYRNQEGIEIKVEVTDTHSIAALLAPSKAVLAMKMKVDDESIYQQTGEFEGLPMIESLEKGTNTARIVLVARDRFLVNLETEAENGLNLLKAFLPGLKIKALL